METSKGRVGKTTLAINLAIALARSGRDVLLIDGDEQGTAAAFTELRTAEKKGQHGYTAVTLQGAAIRTQVRQLSPKYSDIVIDVGGRDTGSLQGSAHSRRCRADTCKAPELRFMGGRPNRRPGNRGPRN